MAVFWVALAAGATAILTLFSGFGLGTLLLPVFAIFFPLEIAVAATAVVHLANNIFKLFLLGRYARRDIVLRFGLPAAGAAFVGAYTLDRLAHLVPVTTYVLGGRPHAITPVGLALGVLIAVFAILDLVPERQTSAIAPRRLWIGGLLSGFFGGLSGHQGALRAAFLSRSGLSRDAFLGSSVTCAVLVDVARLSVYGVGFFGHRFDALVSGDGRRLVIVAALAAFAGSFVGARLVRKVTLRVLQRCVAVGLLVLAVAIGSGLV